jgi:hypothetical protein
LDYIWFGLAYYQPPRWKACTWTNVLPFVVIYKSFINKLVALLMFVSLKVCVDAWFIIVSWYVKYNKYNITCSVCLNGQVYHTDELLSAHVLFSIPIHCLFVVVNTAITASIMKLFSQKI